MTIRQLIRERGIKEVVHFTTNHGCLGALYTKLVQSRQRLKDDPMVEYLFSPNSALRKDPAHLDYVNLSIEHINQSFFTVSSKSWHRDEPIFWCILSFDPLVLTHDGVVFTTTNNIYSGVSRGTGRRGLEALYAEQVIRWRGNVVLREAIMPAACPTCIQAEALYPSALSTEHLQRIYVQSAADQSEVIGFLKASFHRDVQVRVAPEMFG